MTAKTKLASDIEDAAKTARVEAETQAETVLDAAQNAIGSADAKIEGGVTAGKRGFDTIVQGVDATAKCFEAINAETLAYARAVVEDGIAVAQAVLDARSVQQWIEIQTQYSHAALDRFVDYSTKVNDMILCAGKEWTGPLGADPFRLRAAA